MSEVVSKEEYWQIILNDPSKVGQITTEDEKFNKVADFVYTVVQNTLLTSEDDDYLKKYEEMIDISGEGLTPYQRKVNILYMLSGKNYIPLNLVRRGLINMGVSAFDVELLKDENKLVVHTDRADDTQFKRVTALLERVLPENLNIERYNHNMEISWRDINKYAECVTVDDMLAVNPDYKDDVTSDGVWEYPLPNAGNMDRAFANTTKLDVLKGVWAKAYSFSEMTYGNTQGVREVYLELPGCYAGVKKGHNLSQILNSHALTKARLVIPNATSISRICYYTRELRELDLYCPDIKEASNAFISTQLDKPSVLKIIGQLHAFDDGGSHEITIGIHVDHQSDDEVLEAIANAEAKGWTMTVQWNGTPTAQASVTYGLRKPPIYARVGEMERPTGIIERILDWGHYVTNPEDYQEFSSLEEAYEHFNLEMPQIEE